MSELPENPSVADQLRRTNVANIAKRLKAGKTLTAVEQQALRDYEQAETEKKPAEEKPWGSPTWWAAHWRVSRVNIYTWRKLYPSKMPRYDDVDAMLTWEKMQIKKSPAFAARCAELRIERGETKPADAIDKDWIKFRKSASAAAPKDHGEQIKTLEMFRDGYAMKLDDAMRRKDMPEIRRWNELLIETTNAIRQNKLAADKLGLDQGDIVSFSEVDRMIRAWVFWSMRGATLLGESIASDLAALPSGSDTKTILAIIRPRLLSIYILMAFAKASKPSGASLPQRFVEKLRQSMGDFLRDGELAFDEARHRP